MSGKIESKHSDIEMYSVDYTFADAQYRVTDTKDVHTRLRSDASFMLSYFENATTAPELVSVLEETTNSTHTDSKGNNFSWTKQATKLFLDSYLERKDRFRNPKERKKNLWTEILQTMSKNGYANLNEDLLDRKMRNMKKTYKTIKDNNKKSNTGRGRVSWEYFDTFEDIFTNDVTINCCSTLSSMQDNEIIASENIDDPEVTTLIHRLPDFFNDPCHICTLSCSSSLFQPIHPALLGSSSGISSPTLSDQSHSVTPPIFEGSEQSTRMSTLHYMRKRQLDIEDRRIKAIMELKNSIDISNEIQRERNNLLRNLLLLKTGLDCSEENI